MQRKVDKKIDIAIIGASGYTGEALLTLALDRADQIDLVAITSQRHLGKSLREVYPRLADASQIRFESNDHDSIAERARAVFLCMPHTESMRVAPIYLARGRTVFDLGADFRIKDRATYEKWYKTTHAAPNLIGRAIYGMPELYRGQIAQADLIAMPGCYPTATILGLAPAIAANLIDPDSIVVNASSGVSGAGRKSALEYSMGELFGDYFAYQPVNHRHIPEMEQELSLLASREVIISFIPHLLPVKRGLYATIVANLTKAVDINETVATYRSFFAGFRRVKISSGAVKMSWARGSGDIWIGVEIDARADRLIVTSAIDNLIKGAAGQALEAFDIRFGFDETTIGAEQ